VIRGDASDVAGRVGGGVRGEITVVIGGAATAAADPVEAEAAVAELHAAGVPRRQAAELVSRLTGVARNRLYNASL
jgi:16S rRNA (cytidine1402-2'-O)-methyltransferase